MKEDLIEVGWGLTDQDWGFRRKRFFQVKSFALLGDDIVIGDPEVARVYRDVMNRLGIQISLAKTLTANPAPFLLFFIYFLYRKG